MGSDLSQPTSTSFTLRRIFLKYTLHRKLPLASFLLLKSFYVLCLCFSTANMLSPSTCEPNLFDGFLPLGSRSTCYVCSDQGYFFHSGISKLARQPYVLDCFALMLCSSNACRNLSEPPTLTLIIPL